MNHKALLSIFLILIISLGQTSVFAAPTLNMTMASGQTTAPVNIFDFPGNILFKVFTSTQILFQKFIQFDNTGMTAVRNYRFPDTSGTLPVLNNTQTWTGTNTFSGTTDHGIASTKFGSGAIIIRNPASTFATTVTNSAITANQTLNLPLTIQTETIAVQPQINFTSPTNPATTASTTGVMSNLFATFTPKVTGRALVTVCGQMQSGTAGDGAKFDIRYGTSLISQGTAIGNTVVGTTKGITSSTANQPQSACNTVQITGLTINTKIFIQIGKYAVVGGTATFANFNVSVVEI